MKKQIYLAGGCFWGVEKYLELQTGIMETKVGYANGHTKNPTYEEVCQGDTGHAETVFVTYNEKTDLQTVLKQYFAIINPTTVNKQGPDVGEQYRTGIYYVDNEDKTIIEQAIQELQREYVEPIVIEVTPLHCFYEAEAYHQKYLDKNPNGYCHIPRKMFGK